MLRILLYQPEIPPNTGNIIRLCANTGAALHLIEPLGFAMEDRALRRAGLDYHEFASVSRHPSFEAAQSRGAFTRIFAFSTRHTRRYDRVRYQPGDALLFGPETRGLPRSLCDALPSEQRVTLPMRSGSRSLNLSNAVAIAAFEVWRQWGFVGAGVREDERA